MLYRHVNSMKYSVIVFDTAPTGHTLRFLQFPSVLEKALAKLSGLSGKFGPMMQSVRSPPRLIERPVEKLSRWAPCLVWAMA